jgi:hypothetical protein
MSEPAPRFPLFLPDKLETHETVDVEKHPQKAEADGEPEIATV